MKYFMMISSFTSEKNLPPQVAQKLIEIQNEISQIDIHRRKHLTAKADIRDLDQTCKYCFNTYLEVKTKRNMYESSAAKQSTEPIRKDNSTSSKPSARFNNLERTVDSVGKKGQIIVPRTWVGKRVKVVLL